MGYGRIFHGKSGSNTHPGEPLLTEYVWYDKIKSEQGGVPIAPKYLVDNEVDKCTHPLTRFNKGIGLYSSLRRTKSLHVIKLYTLILYGRSAIK